MSKNKQNNVGKMHFKCFVEINLYEHKEWTAILENVKDAQDLTAHGYENIYYFNSKKQGEDDFVIECIGHVLPLEVRSGKDFRYHSALDNLLNRETYDIAQAVVLCNHKIDTTFTGLYGYVLFKKKNLLIKKFR